MDLNKKLSQKGAVIAIVLITLFVVAGIVGSIVGHVFYLSKQKAEITNYSVSESASLRLRNNGTLVYRYEEGETSVDLNRVLTLSKGASLRIIMATDVDGKAVKKKAVLDVNNGEHYFFSLQVVSEAGNKTTDYILEIVAKQDYRVDQPFPTFIDEKSPIFY